MSINTIDKLGDDVVLASLIDGSITEFKDDILTSIGEFAFANCSALTIVDISANIAFTTTPFYFCSNLTTLILRSETMCSMSGKGILDTTLIKKGNGYIYVPRALVGSYQSTFGWQDYASKYRALEDYTVDGTTTGELDPTKI